MKRYLIYAIGEILLIVIGILIALQINNWNNQKKSNEVEHKLLTELYDIVVDDIQFIESTINRNELNQSSCQIILSHFDKNLPYHDSLNIHFQNANSWAKLLLRTSAFENAKSYGLHLIKNDSTRFLLTNIYEYRAAWSKTMDDRQTLYYYNTVVPVLTELFETTSTAYKYEEGVAPHDFEMLKKNKKYRNILKSNIRNRGFENNWIKHILTGMEELKLRLEMELNSF